MYQINFFFYFLLIVNLSSKVFGGPIIETASGLVEGSVSSDGRVNIFRGIPFAKPPTGANRFRRPESVSPWSGVRQAIAQAHICPQIIVPDLLFLGNEDCLYLDVYVPTALNVNNTNENNNLPVLVWIFGGGYTLGDGWEFGFYDGTNLARERNIIVVTFNYRLGPLGLIALEELANEDQDHITGNMALLDQRAALEWVQKNINNFNGNSSRVTIAGESAGGFSVCWHLASAGSKNLFSGAILQSATCSAPEFFVPKENSVSFSKAWAQMIGCNSTGAALLNCLRSLEADVVMGRYIADNATVPTDASILPTFTNHKFKFNHGTSITLSSSLQEWTQKMLYQTRTWDSHTFVPTLYPIMPWGTTIDGTNLGLSGVPRDMIKSNKWNKVPVIMGMNHDEGNIFVPQFASIVPGCHFPLEDQDLTPAFLHFFDNNQTAVDAILNEYPKYETNSAENRASVVLRDYVFACGAESALKSMSNPNNSDNPSVWKFFFTFPGDFIESFILHDYHTAELPFVFDNEWPPIIHKFSENDKIIANTFGTYWSNFIYSGNPNVDRYGNKITNNRLDLNDNNIIYWPEFTNNNLNTIVIDIPAQIQTDLLKDRCEFWDRYESNSL